MNETLCLRTLAEVMAWDNDHARREYQWLRLISRFKYDGYRDFVAGVRFLECLITWLMQFHTTGERQVAYSFIRNRLVYVGAAEMTKLVELCYFETVKPRIAADAAALLDIPVYRLWAHPSGRKTYQDCLRRVLFMGLSEGARTDMLRYAAGGDLTNEQVVGFTQIDPEKWQDLLGDLREDLKHPKAQFRYLFVLDDFTASGTSLLRNPDGLKWKGKLVRLWNSLEHATSEIDESPLVDNWTLCAHHYITTPKAKQAAINRNQEATKELGKNWYPNVEFTFGFELDETTEVKKDTDPDFWQLTDDYYDPSIEPRKHLDECGIDDLRRGYAACALPVILEHNTPNNSLSLLWAESQGSDGYPKMRPLFRRHQRHS